MKNNRNFKGVLISGLALLSMFFGAGNLIFPPSLGRVSGSGYGFSTAGFLITGVGFVFLAVIATVNAGGTLEDLAKQLGPGFSRALSIVILLAIGPGLAIPRTAATSYEIVKGTVLPNLSPVIGSAVFFLIVLFFVLRPGKIIDYLGSILAPALIIILAIIIIKGIINPLGPLGPQRFENLFSLGFTEGYQTMDALAAMIFTSGVIANFISSGVRKEDLKRETIWAGVIASLGLGAIYAGFIYLGASSNISREIGRVELLIRIAGGVLGNTGKYAISAAMILACLTTSIGLVNMVGLSFKSFSRGRLSYRTSILLIILFSSYFAVVGVDEMVRISAPILGFIYPIGLVLIFLNLLGPAFQRRSIYLGGAIGAGVFSAIDSLNQLGINLGYQPLEALVSTELAPYFWIPMALALAGIFFIFKVGEQRT